MINRSRRKRTPHSGGIKKKNLFRTKRTRSPGIMFSLRRAILSPKQGVNISAFLRALRASANSALSLASITPKGATPTESHPCAKTQNKPHRITSLCKKPGVKRRAGAIQVPIRVARFYSQLPQNVHLQKNGGAVAGYCYVARLHSQSPSPATRNLLPGPSTGAASASPYNSAPAASCKRCQHEARCSRRGICSCSGDA